MKQLALAIFVLFSVTVTAQNSFYASTALSVSSTDTSTFRSSSYSSIEIGRTWDNFSLGTCLGSSDLNFSGGEGSFWWEAKGSLSFPVKTSQLFFLAGGGNYIGTDRVFVEYGAGFSRPVLKTPLSWFLQASSWDSKGYVSVGASVTL